MQKPIAIIFTVASMQNIRVKKTSKLKRAFLRNESGSMKGSSKAKMKELMMTLKFINVTKTLCDEIEYHLGNLILMSYFLVK